MIALRQALERARRRPIIGVVCLLLLVLLLVLVSLHLGEDAQHVEAAACLAAIVGLLLAIRPPAPPVFARVVLLAPMAPRPPPRLAARTPSTRSLFLPLLL